MQAENAFLIKQISERLDRLETDMLTIKREQFQHDSQIDALALEIHELKDDVHFMQKSTDKHFHEVKHQLNLVMDALAIKR